MYRLEHLIRAEIYVGVTKEIFQMEKGVEKKLYSASEGISDEPVTPHTVRMCG